MKHNWHGTGWIRPRWLLATAMAAGLIAVSPSASAEGPPPEDINVVVGFGDNHYSQIGTGVDVQNYKFPIKIAGALAGRSVSSVSASKSSTCAISTGALYCWGENTHGQIGIASQGGNVKTPTLVSGLLSGKFVTSVSAGENHTCATTTEGKAYCWGANWDGELGDGTTTLRTSPVAVSTSAASALFGLKVKSITTGFNHTCTVTSDDKAACWGINYDGQLGVPIDFSPFTQPVFVQTDGALKGAKFIQVSAGWGHTCGLTTTAAVACWGENKAGELGLGFANIAAHKPGLVTTMGALKGIKISSIDVGDNHSCAIGNNTAFCWGDASAGQLGNNTAVGPSPSPLKVQVDGPVSSISAGGHHTCLIVSNTARCTGRNQFGQLGNGTTTNSVVPVLVNQGAPLSSLNELSVTAGGSHTFVLAKPIG